MGMLTYIYMYIYLPHFPYRWAFVALTFADFKYITELVVTKSVWYQYINMHARRRKQSPEINPRTVNRSLTMASGGEDR